MVESMLRAAGLRTGLFTSPHLHDYTERIRIDGEPVSQDDFARLVEEMRPAVEAEREAIGERSFVTFDLLTALGFMAFREAGVDAQVIEVGLGGRVDSTNVFATKEVAVITPLSFEHTAILGDKIEQIAAEKAAIITPGCIAVMAPQRYPEAAARRSRVRGAGGRASGRGGGGVSLVGRRARSARAGGSDRRAARRDRGEAAAAGRVPGGECGDGLAAVDAPRRQSGGHPQAPGMGPAPLQTLRGRRLEVRRSRAWRRCAGWPGSGWRCCGRGDAAGGRRLAARRRCCGRVRW